MNSFDGDRPVSGGPTGRLPVRALIALHLALLAATLAPVLSVEFLALADLPNHLARLHILTSIDRDPALQANYVILPAPPRYLLVDWLLTPLARVFDVYFVGRLFAAATMTLTYAGVVLLSVTLQRRLSVWPALALPILYHYAFSWGFMIYCFGMGALLVAVAIWLRFRGIGGWRRFLLLLGLSATLYLAHMLIFGQFAVIVAAHAVAEAWDQRSRRVAALLREAAADIPPLVLTAAAYLVVSIAEEVTGARTTIYGGLADKLVALLSPTLFTDSPADLALIAVYLAGAVILALTGRLSLAPGMGLPLVAMTLLSAAMPNTLLGVWGVDFRLPPVLIMLAIAATEPRALTLRPAHPAASAAIAFLVLFRAVTVWAPLHGADRQFAEFREAARTIPEGARLIVSIDEGSGTLAMPPRAYWHMAQLAVIERAAFVPFLFTDFTHVGVTERNREIDTASGHPMSSAEIERGLDPDFIATQGNRQVDAYHRIYWADWPANFDYLIRINPTPLSARMAEATGPAERFGFFDILPVRRLP